MDKEGEIEAQRRLKDYFAKAETEVRRTGSSLKLSIFCCVYMYMHACMYVCYKCIMLTATIGIMCKRVYI